MIKILSATGFLGYGIEREGFKRAISMNPDVIAVDASSTDPGPYYLGEGEPLVPKGAIKEDLYSLLEASIEKKIRLIIGGACGCGNSKSLEWMLEIIKEIAIEKGYHFKAAIIKSDVTKEYIIERLKKVEGRSICPHFGSLSPKDVEESVSIVAQIGVEPFIKALESDAEIIIAGRSIDNAMFASLPILKGYSPALAWHLGKAMECAGMVAVPTGISNPIMGEVHNDHFLLYPGHKELRCTVESVVSHSLYERDDPFVEEVPGGVLDLSNCNYEQFDNVTVKVTGSQFMEAPASIKIEGVKHVGYRSIAIFGVRDPILVKKVDYVIGKAKEMVKKQFERFLKEEDYKIEFYVYGKNGVMGEMEIVKDYQSHELGIVVECVAKTQALAKDVAYFAYGAFQHLDYPGILCTGANVAIPFSPPDVDMGSTYEFNIYHVLPIENPEKLFPYEIRTF